MGDKLSQEKDALYFFGSFRKSKTLREPISYKVQIKASADSDGNYFLISDTLLPPATDVNGKQQGFTVDMQEL